MGLATITQQVNWVVLLVQNRQMASKIAGLFLFITKLTLCTSEVCKVNLPFGLPFTPKPLFHPQILLIVK
jgi:hypothetical protein